MIFELSEFELTKIRLYVILFKTCYVSVSVELFYNIICVSECSIALETFYVLVSVELF
jgi:hypothetical protein